ncbi:MAG: hypothetical protein HY348_10450 [Nitrospira defluvii]|nr:hypothetical protein [Nitrospira defluvii]
MSILIRIAGGLTHSETSGYSVVMLSWREGLFVLSMALLQPAMATVGAVALPEQAESVPADEYPFYDVAVDAKFLTSQTRLIILERMTTTRLHPDQPFAPTVAWFTEQAWFDGRLPQDLIQDFVAKNQHPSRLDARFAFGVRYRFVSGEGVPETEAAFSVMPVAWSVQDLEGKLDTIDRLAFSRVGRTLRGDQALLYVANHRRDGTGAGFLL